MVGEPSRCQLLPAPGREISILLVLSPANSSQHLSGIIEAALPGPGAKIADDPDTEPTAELRRNIAERPVHRGKDIRALRRGKAGSRFMSNL
jgi:hypothetical protein